jgi:hypothetical protein
VVQHARLVLAPCVLAQELKEIIEAMQCGTPTSLSIGAESMHGDLPWNGFITDDQEVFVNEAVLLYEDEKLWLQAQKKRN